MKVNLDAVCLRILFVFIIIIVIWIKAICFLIFKEKTEEKKKKNRKGLSAIFLKIRNNGLF